MLSLFISHYSIGRWWRRGQAALSTIFLIGGIIVLFGISLAIITLAMANSTFGFQAANKAFAVALGGIQDSELQLLRNKNFASSYCVPYATLPCPSGHATVTVLQNSPTAGKVTVISDAVFNRRRRKLESIYFVSATTSQVSQVSFKELTL